jgi:hypothetical protein
MLAPASAGCRDFCSKYDRPFYDPQRPRSHRREALRHLRLGDAPWEIDGIQTTMERLQYRREKLEVPIAGWGEGDLPEQEETPRFCGWPTRPKTLEPLARCRRGSILRAASAS